MASFNVASDLQTKELVWIAKSSKTNNQLIVAGEINASTAANISRVYAERYSND
jgi:hypothetical protein